MTKTLLSPYKLNDALTLKNRIVMAPMTRAAADQNNAPKKESATYYARRADAGLVITEGTVIRPDGIGYPSVPGIYTQTQIDQWKVVSDAVHQRGGKVFMQIWHVGRVTHPSYLGGELPISPSATTMAGRVRRTENLYYGKSRAVTVDEIQDLVESFVQAAKNAMQAGFDGIEIHGANGYLVDQFLHYDTNKREDEYGGTPENMARFALQVVQAIGQEIGFERVGLRLSPAAYLNEINSDARDEAVFKYLLQQLSQLSLAYIHTGNFDDSSTFAALSGMTMTAFIRAHYTGTVIASGGYSSEVAERGMSENQYDLVAIGRPFIANPDFVSRVEQQMPIKDYDAEMLKVLY